MTSNTFAIRADYMLNAARFVSSEQSRYYLRGIYLHAAGDGTRVVSTDGHRLGMFFQADTFTPRPSIIRLSKDGLAACKAKRTDGDFTRYVAVSFGSGDLKRPAAHTTVAVILASSAEEATSIHDAMAPTAQILAIDAGEEIDGTFPDYERVIPPLKNDGQQAKTCPAFNPKYLADFALQHPDSKGSGCISVMGAGPGAPHIVRHADYPEFLGVLMPMRGPGHLIERRPRWLDATARQAAE